MKPYYFILSLLSAFIISCDKDTEVVYLDPFHPDQEQFRSSLFVKVVNASGKPVANATIRIGNYKRETDIRGFIYLENVLVGASTYLTAEKDGYFHASRRFYPTAGSSQYIRLIMLPDSRDAFFSSGTGAVLPVDNKVTFRFPKDGYEYLNGASYDGVVTVSAKVIPADDPELSYKMPGDLTGIDANGQPGSLASMGMVAVELQSSAGSRLRLKEGVKVQIEMAVPASQLEKAPSVIPMWYFDEDGGVWKEEGTATLSGNLYIANVSHFSYWNYDAWFPAIKWGAIFDFGNRGLASQLEVCITILALNTTKCAYTNSEGMVCGLVAANELLLMEVRNECGDIIYSEEIGPFSDSTMLGPITLPEPGLFITTVSGHAVGCSGDPVTNGFATITIGGVTQHAVLDDLSGAFSVTVNSCDESDIQIVVTDVAHLKHSLPVTIDYTPVADADTITVCENIQEIIDLEIVGIPEHYYFYDPGVEVDEIDEQWTFINANDGFAQGSQISFSFMNQNTGVHELYLSACAVHLPNKGWFFVNDTTGLNSNLVITHYGKVGDYITGTINSTCIHENPGSPNNEEYPLIVSFSVLREE